MSGWKRLYPKPAGSLPGGIVTQWGVALITVLLLVFIGIWLAGGAGEETALEAGIEGVTAPARDFAGSMAAQVQAEAMRAETRRSAAERALQAQQRQVALAGGSAGAGQVTVDEARLLAGASPGTGEAYTEENGSFGSGCGLRPWNGGPGRFAVRRSRRLIANWIEEPLTAEGRTPRRTLPLRSAPRAQRPLPGHSGRLKA